MRTATLTAFSKTFTDIPFAKEIYCCAMNQIISNHMFTYDPSFFDIDLSLELEGRHKGINAIINQYNGGCDNLTVIEIACGLSSRRIEYGCIKCFYEIDYAPIIELKSEVYKSLSFPSEDSLFGLDITNLMFLNQLLLLLNEKASATRIIIVSEGLFWYLSREKLEGLISTIARLYKGFNTVWISGDCPVESKYVREKKSVIAESSNIKRNLLFTDRNDYFNLFEKKGFKSSAHKILDLVSIDQISSRKLFDIDQKECEKRLKNYTDIAVFQLF